MSNPRQQINSDKYLYALRLDKKYFYVGVSDNPVPTLIKYLQGNVNNPLNNWISEKHKESPNIRFALEDWSTALKRYLKEDVIEEKIADNTAIIYIDIYKFIPSRDYNQNYIYIDVSRTERNELIRDLQLAGHNIINKPSGKKKTE